MSQSDQKLKRNLPAKWRRLIWLVLILLSLSVSVFFFLRVFSANLLFFTTPSQLATKQTFINKEVRLGGMVVANSWKQGERKHRPIHWFDVTDGQASQTIYYAGIMPDLFREGQSVVVLGHLNSDNVFVASEVLARHDETYMPPEVAKALQESGKWDPRFGSPPAPEEWQTMIKAK
ncbi:cytochrome c maturation protein CcmE [Acetobacteraceae bacterium]|nr:cytochrome c maturation protein CcmE [Acetobacteraceae bacterium]